MRLPLLALVGCSTATTPEVAAPDASRSARLLDNGTPGNFLVVMLDDVSTFQLPAYGADDPAIAPTTPTIDALAATGVRFSRAYSFPSCTPARAAMLTGRLPIRYGLGNAIDASDETHSLPLSEVTLAEALAQSPYGYTSALVGKWHLSSPTFPGGVFGPNDQGFSYASGTLENLGTPVTDIGEDRNYFHWERITNGKPEKIDEYATTVTANDVVSRVAVLPEPWFVLAAFNAPHIPYNEPPESLVHHPLTTLCKIDKPACFRATVEAVDTEIGRMLSEMDPAVLARTTIVFLSDNGAAEEAISPPNDPERSKGTLFDGGIQIPFIVSGAQVTAPGVCDGFVSVLDVFGTLVELAEVPPLTAWDGQPLVSDAVSFAHQLADPTAASLAPRDTHVYSEIIHPNGPPPYNNIERMVRTDDYKMVRDAVDHLYAYAPKALDEGPDLMNGDPPLKVDAGGNLELRTILEAYESLTYEGP